MKCYQLCLKQYVNRKMDVAEALNTRRNLSALLKLFSNQHGRKYDWVNRFIMIANDEDKVQLMLQYDLDLRIIQHTAKGALTDTSINDISKYAISLGKEFLEHKEFGNSQVEEWIEFEEHYI